MPDMKLCAPAENPPACASCGGQYPDRRHVDFGSAWDGPVLNQLEVAVQGATPMTVDDLKVCESCVREAMHVLQLADMDVPKVRKLQSDVERLQAMNDSQGRYIQTLEESVAAKSVVRRKVPA
jgi:hypothetical protein